MPSAWLDPGPGGEHLAVEDFITFHVGRLANASQRNITRRYLRPFGLSAPEWRLLSLLARFSPVGFTRLCQLTSMDKAQASRTVRLLIKKGLANSQTDPTHQRKVVVSMTEGGAALFQEILPEARRHQLQLFDALSLDDRRHLFAILAKLATVIAS